MKIAILNECFLGEEHLSRLKALGEVEVFDSARARESFRENLPELVVSAVENFIKGTPINLVN